MKYNNFSFKNLEKVDKCNYKPHKEYINLEIRIDLHCNIYDASDVSYKAFDNSILIHNNPKYHVLEFEYKLDKEQSIFITEYSLGCDDENTSVCYYSISNLIEGETISISDFYKAYYAFVDFMNSAHLFIDKK